MFYLSAVLERFIRAFSALPGVGIHTARRYAYHLLLKDSQAGHALLVALQDALSKLRTCQACCTLCEDELCSLCQDSTRDASQLCIVETTADLCAIEQTGVYKGYYFVLAGHISPLEGTGLSDLQWAALQKRVAQGQVTELVVATNFTHEGELTAHYLIQFFKNAGIHTITRLARGMPVEAEIEYVDAATIAQSILSRREA